MKDPTNVPPTHVELSPEQQYLVTLAQKYTDTIQMVPEEVRSTKEQQVARTFASIENRFKALGDFQFGPNQKAILKLKLARHFQRDETCDVNTLVDALVETPRFLQKEQGSIRKLFEVHEVKTLQK